MILTKIVLKNLWEVPKVFCIEIVWIFMLEKFYGYCLYFLI